MLTAATSPFINRFGDFLTTNKRGTSAPWSIVSEFNAGQQGAFYDASESANVWQSHLGTTAASDGDVVGCLDDLSPNVLHMKQSTALAKPIRRTAGGLWYVETDGAGDFMASSTGMSLGPTPFYIFMAFEKLADTSLTIFGAHVTTTDYARFSNVTSSRVQVQTRILSLAVGPEVLTTAVSAVPVNTPTVAIMKVAAGLTSLWINGSAVITAANSWTGAENVANCGISLTGNGLAASSNAAIKFYAGGLIEKDLSAGAFANLKTQLGSKVGLTL